MILPRGNGGDLHILVRSEDGKFILYLLADKRATSNGGDICKSISFTVKNRTPIDTTFNANFTSDFTIIKEGEYIQFSDESTGNPSSWLWTFEGGNPYRTNEKNPRVLYERSGSYSVKLVTEGSSKKDSIIFENYITVGEIEIPEEFDVIGTWERIESNNPSLNGMRVSVNRDETEGKIVYSPSSNFSIGDLKWKNMVKVSKHEYIFDDRLTSGDYAEGNSIFIIAYGNELILGNFNDSNAGSFQRWERVDFQYPEDEDYNIIGTWDRTKSNNPRLDGMVVLVNNNQNIGVIINSPDESGFPINQAKWRNMIKEDKNRFRLEDLRSSGDYTEARIFITAKGKELVLGSFDTVDGSFQRWTRR